MIDDARLPETEPSGALVPPPHASTDRTRDGGAGATPPLG